uniref:Uncharacterized protein n=1 Tax=Anguilla anguilla TaxID=7936 RepID=A0A0E9TX17_ANGAN
MKKWHTGTPINCSVETNVPFKAQLNQRLSHNSHVNNN